MTSKQKHLLPSRLHNQFLAIVSILVFVPLVFHMYVGRFSRYLADDFCTAATLQRLGFLESLEFWRLTWSGRYSFYFVINLIHLIGTWITPFMTAITLIAWLFALYLLAAQFLTLIQALASRGFALFLAGFVLFAALSTSPDVYQSLYWQTGQVTYVLPLILLTFYAAFLLRKANSDGKVSAADILIAVLVPLVAGGFSETIAALQVTFLAILVLIVLIQGHLAQRNKLILLLSLGLVAAIAALTLVVSAPGNQARLAFMPSRLGAFELVKATAQAVYYYAKLTAYKYPVLTLTALLAPGLIIWMQPIDDFINPYSRRRVISFLVLAPLATVVLAASIIVPSIYATADIPAGRVVVTLQFILLSAMTAWSVYLGLWVRRAWRAVKMRPYLAGTAASLLLAASVITASARILEAVPTAQAYAASWDRRDREIRSAVDSGTSEMQAASLPHMAGLAELNKNPDDWLNQCFASYYGLDKVSSKK